MLAQSDNLVESKVTEACTQTEGYPYFDMELSFHGVTLQLLCVA